MSRIIRLRKTLVLLFRNPRLFFGSEGYIFIMSHMRSRSSLLSHILGSNPAISGYSETHKSYVSWRDFARLSIHVFLGTSGTLNQKYALDKILWDRHGVSEQMCLEKETL